MNICTKWRDPQIPVEQKCPEAENCNAHCCQNKNNNISFNQMSRFVFSNSWCNCDMGLKNIIWPISSLVFSDSVWQPCLVSESLNDLLSVSQHSNKSNLVTFSWGEKKASKSTFKNNFYWLIFLLKVVVVAKAAAVVIKSLLLGFSVRLCILLMNYNYVTGANLF